MLRVKDVKSLLGVSSVSKFRSNLHRLELPRRTTLYPKGYTEHFAAWLHLHRKDERRPLKDYAKRFALTGAAAGHIVVAETNLETEISQNSREVENTDELMISAGGIAKVLGVTHTLAKKWAERDQLLRPVERRGQNLFTLSNFAEIYHWRHPEALPDNDQQTNQQAKTLFPGGLRRL